MRSRGLLAGTVLLVLASLSFAPSALASQIKVMTRNIYLGADIAQLGLAPNRATFTTEANKMWGTVKANNFPLRARYLAREIAQERPDFLGLQEAATWYISPRPGAKPTKVAYDYTALLQKELRKAKVPYEVVVRQGEFDFTAPISASASVRFLQNDVLLRRKSSTFKVASTSRGQYSLANTFVIETAVGKATSTRGWLSASVVKGNSSFQVVNTHLESYGDAIRTGQARELLAGPLADTSRKTILMGDLNSGPGDIPVTLASYEVFPQAGFEDVWGSRQDIRTFGRNERLTAVRPDSYWYDHIMFRPSSGLEAVSRKLTGTKPFTSSPKGPRWSSDHDGVVAVIAEK